MAVAIVMVTCENLTPWKMVRIYCSCEAGASGNEIVGKLYLKYFIIGRLKMDRREWTEVYIV